MARLPNSGRPRAALFLGVSLVGAVIAAYAVVRVLQTAQDEIEAARQGPNTIPVVIATRNLEMGLSITDEDVSIRHLLPEMVPGEEVYSDAEIVIGRTPRAKILVNEMLRRERLAAADAGVTAVIRNPCGVRWNLKPKLESLRRRM